MPRYEPPPPDRLQEALQDATLILSADLEVLHADPNLPAALGPYQNKEMPAAIEAAMRCLRPVIDEMVEASEDARLNLDLTCQDQEPWTCRATVIRVTGRECDVWLVSVHNKLERERVLEAVRIATKFRALTRHYRLSAHDLKQPIAVLGLYTQLLRDKLPAEPPDIERQQGSPSQYVGVIESATRTLSHSLTTLLDHLSEDTEIATEFSMNIELENAIEFAHHQAKTAHVAIETRLPGGDIRLRGSPGRFRQMINNLAVNALEAMPDGGTLRILCRREGNHAVITVADDGPGMDDETARRCFDFHFTTKSSGHGVGLTGVQQIVTQMKGSLTLDTAPDQGCTFTIRLPITQ